MPTPGPLCESELPDSVFEGLDGKVKSNAAQRKAFENSAKSRKYDQRHHPTTSDPDYSQEELEFMMAVHAYKQKTGRQFPTLKETFGIFTALGYTKTVRAQVYVA